MKSKLKEHPTGRSNSHYLGFEPIVNTNKQSLQLQLKQEQILFIQHISRYRTLKSDFQEKL